MPIPTRYDAVIAGGGLAGTCLAIQLKRSMPELEVLVAEKRPDLAPHAAHKVGESSVEIASQYFRDKVGVGDLLGDELPKFGLRFLMGGGRKLDIAERLECGPSHFLYVPSFQIDRGQFENALVERARSLDVRVENGVVVRDFALGDGDGDHRVVIEHGGGQREVRCRWLVDASGRASLLKKKLDLAKPNRHNVNAAWFRVDGPIEMADWSDDLHWRARLKHPRRLSTNHLMGEGYWVWLIPLAGDRTSVGIVADDNLHPFAEISSFERAMEWLGRHEPQCAAALRERDDPVMDFRALKNYSHDVKQAFSPRRFGLIGDAGLFIDPLYSPGSDFIGIANGYLTDLIIRDRRGEDVSGRAERYDQAYRSYGRTYLVNYHRQYTLMGSAHVMTTKIVWDFVMYWGGVALLFFGDRLCDEAFTERVRPIMQRFASMNVRIQTLFRSWAAASKDLQPRPGTFIDYAELGFLADLNKELEHEYDDEALVAQLEKNLRLADDLRLEILTEAAGCMPSLADSALETPRTEYLSETFAAMRP